MLKLTLIMWTVAVFVASSALAGTWVDNFENPAFTQRSWEIVQGEWQIEDGWWEAFSEGTAKPAIALLFDVETHDGLTMEITQEDLGIDEGIWVDGFIIFAYLDETEIYYAGARVGQPNWSVEKNDKDTGAQQYLKQINDGKFEKNVGIVPRYEVAIEGDDVVIYTDGDDESLRHSFGKMPVGRVGLFVQNARTRFDDFVISGPAVKALAVESVGKLATTWARIKGQL